MRDQTAEARLARRRPGRCPVAAVLISAHLAGAGSTEVEALAGERVHEASADMVLDDAVAAHREKSWKRKESSCGHIGPAVARPPAVRRAGERRPQPDAVDHARSIRMPGFSRESAASAMGDVAGSAVIDALHPAKQRECAPGPERHQTVRCAAGTALAEVGLITAWMRWRAVVARASVPRCADSSGRDAQRRSKSRPCRRMNDTSRWTSARWHLGDGGGAKRLGDGLDRRSISWRGAHLASRGPDAPGPWAVRRGATTSHRIFERSISQPGCDGDHAACAAFSRAGFSPPLTGPHDVILVRARTERQQ